VTQTGHPTVTQAVPAIRYRDLARAVPWLCDAFGFEEPLLVKDDNGDVVHAQVAFGQSMLMLLPVGGSDLDSVMKQPDEIGGAETQSCYFYVPDADAHYEKAKAAGAGIVLDIRDYANGCRGYSCRDLEGHIWNFGTYDPWQGRLPATPQPPRSGMRQLQLMATVGAAALVIGVLAGWKMLSPSGDARELDRLRFEVLTAQQRADTINQKMARQLDEITQERTARDNAVRGAQSAREQLAREESAKETIEINAKITEKNLTETRRAKESAERAAAHANEQIEREKSARELAERNAQRLQNELAQQREARNAAERTASTAAEESARDKASVGQAQTTAAEARKQAEQDREARRRAEQAAQNALDALNKERTAREAAELTAKEARDKLDEMRRAERTVEQKPAKETIVRPPTSTRRAAKRYYEPVPD
jgi:uncharacterized glyoxalase superfamily protein PhnB